MARKSAPPTTTDVDPNEMWPVVRVASFLSIPYQSARNQMLEGRFGESHYDGATRKLTVLASSVRAVKSKRGRKKKTRRSRS